MLALEAGFQVSRVEQPERWRGEQTKRRKRRRQVPAQDTKNGRDKVGINEVRSRILSEDKEIERSRPR
jgi:hypothetical protein